MALAVIIVPVIVMFLFKYLGEYWLPLKAYPDGSLYIRSHSIPVTRIYNASNRIVGAVRA